MPRTPWLPTLVTMYAPGPDSAAGLVLAAPRWLRTRIEDTIAQHGTTMLVTFPAGVRHGH